MKNAEAEIDSPARRLTQAERRDRSERELISAAIKVVAEQGVSAATFDAIARKAGEAAPQPGPPRIHRHAAAGLKRRQPFVRLAVQGQRDPRPAHRQQSR